jgi:hypothetical protein
MRATLPEAVDVGEERGTWTMTTTVLASCAIDHPDCVDTGSVDSTLAIVVIVGIIAVVLAVVVLGIVLLGRSADRR